MKFKRPQQKLQTSTQAGGLSLIGTLLLVFGNVKLNLLWPTLLNLTFDQITPILMILGGSLWSIIHKEKSKDDYIKEQNAKKDK